MFLLNVSAPIIVPSQPTPNSPHPQSRSYFGPLTALSPLVGGHMTLWKLNHGG